jgi:uncharacterized protein YcbK (DUF882 family)
LLLAAGAAAIAPVAVVSLLTRDERRRPVEQPRSATSGRTADALPREAMPIAPDRARLDDARTPPNARRLSFAHTHTGERLSVVYAYGDRRVPEALALLDWLLRDFRDNSMHSIDPALFDQLHALHRITESQAAFEIVSGYRSPATNAMLHRKSDGVAARSLHLVGQAIDLRLPDVPLADLRDAALSLRAGGVGFYRASNFVHLVTGRVRRW